MSDFLGRVGHITEWVVVSNLENRAINAAFNKTENWWKSRKEKKNGSNGKSTNSAQSVRPPSPSQSQGYNAAPPSQNQQPQPFFAPQQPPPPPSMGPAQLLITVNHLNGLNQWGPLIVNMECNHQRYQTALENPQQHFAFPIYQFDKDLVYIWVQTQNQQQTVALGEIAVGLLLNNYNSWAPPQERWIPLRDQNYGSAGQLVITVQYQPTNSASSLPLPPPPPPPPPPQYMPGPPPPYSYYS